ncbi:MAG: hypothetical protein IPL83_13795 [Bdellovibrionales bacterium]|nr:hypothetical protein [Bdellovibrionales bacterium]
MSFIRKYSRHLIVMTAITIYVGCSDVKFQSVPSDQCAEANSDPTNSSCFEAPGWLNYHFEFKVGRMDILFVDDNSGSMYVEQTSMADRFPNLLNEISGLDYQIAIVTTDISSSPGNSAPRKANGNGAFQDGKFLKFSNGDTLISANTPEVVQKFRETIKRNETSDCDTATGSACPSGDERGIFALNMALDQADGKFFRSDSHLAVVILSDEDERTNGGNISGYPLETYDLPLTFAQKIHTQLGASKTVSVHTIIIQPGDTSCFNIQNSQTGVKGYYGYQYARLANANQDPELKAAHSSFLAGRSGSICAGDYGAQMGDIGNLAAVNANIKVLPCVPTNDKIKVAFSPTPGTQINFNVNSERLLTFNPQPPPGTTVSVDVTCPK